MFLNIHNITHRLFNLIQEHLFYFFRLGACSVIQELLSDGIFKSYERVSPAGRQYRPEEIGNPVYRWTRHNIGGRSLNHRHLFGFRRHIGNQGHSGGARADHDHLLTRVIEVFRPKLRMYPCTLEVFASLELRLMT